KTITDLIKVTIAVNGDVYRIDISTNTRQFNMVQKRKSSRMMFHLNNNTNQLVKFNDGRRRLELKVKSLMMVDRRSKEDYVQQVFSKIREGLTVLYGGRSGVPTVFVFGSGGDGFWEEA
nr:hypothetical protein [Tanacetum cinerariifolium]